MLNTKTETSYTLDREGVDTASADVEKWLRDAGVNRENIIRIRLTMEELMLNICEHYGGSVEGKLSSGKRFGSPYLSFRYEGESFDPMSSDEASAGEWTRVLLANIGLTPVWNYRRGVNCLTLRAPRETMRSETMLILATLLAILLGALRNVIPAQVTQRLLEHVLTPASDAFMNVLGTFVGPMVFLSVVAGICSIGSLSDFSKIGRYVLIRMAAMTTLGTGIAAAVALPLFKFGEGTMTEGSSQLGAVIDLLFAVFPSDPVTPFVQGSMLQIIFMAVMVGCAMLVLEDQVKGIKDLINQSNLLIMQIVQGICGLLPLYIFLSLLAMILQNGARTFMTLWKPIAVHTAIIILFFIFKLLIVCGRLRVGPVSVLEKMKGTMLIGLTTASSSAAFGNMVNVNESKFGIASELDRIGLPFANIILSSTHGSLLIVIVYYLSEIYAVPISFVWLITAWIMCSVLSMTIPPVSGGMLVVTGIVMFQLGIPAEGLAVAGLLGIICDFTATAVKIGITHLEMLLQAEHLDMIDRPALES